jgi:hypothetical protein
LLVGFNYQNYRTTLDSITTDNQNNVLDLTNWFESNSSEGFVNAKYTLNYSPAKRHYLKFGNEARFRNYNFDDERFTSDYRLLKDGNAYQNIAFANWNWRITPTLTSNIGVTSQYLDIDGQTTFEPRAALSWSFLPRHQLNVGYGLHRQSLPLLLYYAEDTNQSLDFMQSAHYVAGYSYQLNEKSIIKAEAYYKDISNVPVENDPNSTWSFLNSGTSFGVVGVEEAVSNGMGKAYGAELSYIRNFADGYYITGTFSYVRQEYKAGDGVWRWGAFDNQIILNLLAGYEWVVSPTYAIEFSARYTLAGGNPYTPIDLEASAIEGETERDFSRAFGVRAPDYSRFDIRVDFRQNFRGLSLISYISVENVLNTENIQTYVYDAQNNEVQAVSQLGFFPVGGIRIEF